VTTKGHTRVDHRGEAVRGLPEIIASREAAGQPVIVAWPLEQLGPIPEDKQRLYATLGVLVRLVPPRTEEG
jgi:hypothetical protein